jgi:predicted transcriptional regulator
MARRPKEQEVLHCRLDKAISEKLTEYAIKTKRTRTAIVELALTRYFEDMGTSDKSDTK